jgi:Asp/Glu/hydantoin racemase
MVVPTNPPHIGLVHATLAAVQPMVAAFRRFAPDVKLLHFLDEGLLPMAERDGLTPAAVEEVERLIRRAIASGADGVLLTCSAYSPAVGAVQARIPAPVVSVDEAMLRGALECGRTLGVVATVSAAGPTTAKLLQTYAAENGRTIEVNVRVVPDAFAALKNDDGARHDALVREQIAALMPACDAVVLAQISMARAIDGMPPFAKPVLTSPETSIRAILSRLHSVPR